MSHQKYSDMAIKRFWSKVQKSDGCWTWLASISGGYGQLRLNGRKLCAHRFAYEVSFGNIPPGKLVCHSCDVRRCVRPEHLFLGTPQENMDDMIRKGRARNEAKGLHGERNSQAKLTASQVLEIRRATGTPQKELARRYGVAQTNISRIISGQIWRVGSRGVALGK